MRQKDTEMTTVWSGPPKKQEQMQVGISRTIGMITIYVESQFGKQVVMYFWHEVYLVCSHYLITPDMAVARGIYLERKNKNTRY